MKLISSVRSPLLRAGAVAACLAASVTASGEAMATSTGCSLLDGTSATMASIFMSSGYSLLAGEVVTVTFDNPDVAMTATFKADAGGTASTVRGTTSTFPATISFTIDTTDNNWAIELSHDAGFSRHVDYTFTCTGESSGGSGGAVDHSAGYSNTVRSAARSQTDVLEKNLDARIDAAFQAVAGRDLGDGGPLGQQFAALAASRQELDGGRAFFDGPGQTSRSITLRELATLGAFDTSTNKLGATADDGTDPAEGTGKRSTLATTRPFTLWGHGTYVALDNDFNQGGADNRYDGDAWGYTLGFDYRADPRLVVGLSLGYTTSDIDTYFNSGDYKETGWSLAPYLVARPIDGLTLSAVAGYGWGDVDQTQSGASGSTDSTMWFMALRGAYKVQPIEGTPLDVTGRVGLLAGHKKVDAFTLNDGTAVAEDIANTRRVKPGLEVAYAFDAGGTKLQPFVNADLIYDLIDEVNDDGQAVSLGGGLRIASGATGLSGTLSVDRQFGREDYKSHSVNGMVAYNFALGGGDGGEGTVSPFVSTDIHAAGSQMFGGGIRFTGPGGRLNCEFGLTHVLYVSEADNDDDDLTAGETVGMLRTRIEF